MMKNRSAMSSIDYSKATLDYRCRASLVMNVQHPLTQSFMHLFTGVLDVSTDLHEERNRRSCLLKDFD